MKFLKTFESYEVSEVSEKEPKVIPVNKKVSRKPIKRISKADIRSRIKRDQEKVIKTV